MLVLMNLPAGELTISEGIEHQFTVEEMDDETYTGLLIYKWVKLAHISTVFTGLGETTVNFRLQPARTDCWSQYPEPLICERKS